MRDRRLRADEATVARSLHGNWRDEHLFALTHALAHYDFLGEQISACDQMISQALKSLPNLSEETNRAGQALRQVERFRSSES